MSNRDFIRAHQRRQQSLTVAGRLAGAGRLGDRRSQGQGSHAHAGDGETLSAAAKPRSPSAADAESALSCAVSHSRRALA